MNRKHFHNSLLILFFLIPVLSCKTDMSGMLEDYNENFTIEYSKSIEALSPGDKGFDQHYMLYDEYFVYDDATLVLSAPEKCSLFDWVFTDPDDDYSEVTVMFRDITAPELIKQRGTHYTKKLLSVYVPESDLIIGKTYKLTLTVISEGGNTYTDSCGVIIYTRYNR